VRYVDADKTAGLEEQITSATRMIYVESPTNPMLRIVDLRATAAISKKHGLLFCVDNGTMSPYLQNPLDLGVDIALHLATKFLCRHSDVTGGVIVVKDAKLAADVYFLQNAQGTALGPLDCDLLSRDLKTLKVRMDAQQRDAALIASFLSLHSDVKNVYFPGEQSHAGYTSREAQARGGGAVLSFTAASAVAAKSIAENSKLFSTAVSFGMSDPMSGTQKLLALGGVCAMCQRLEDHHVHIDWLKALLDMLFQPAFSLRHGDAEAAMVLVIANGKDISIARFHRTATYQGGNRLLLQE
jgi:cystathionine beta-lyase